VNENRRSGQVTEAQLARLGSRLTGRDHQIALDCYEHRVLTTEQLQRLYFSGARTARSRLQALYSLRVLDRFRPPWRRGEGSTQHHWVLDEGGAHIVAAERGIERRELRWRHAAAFAVATSAKLAHHVEVNELFTRLAQQASAAGGSLSEWYGERTTYQLLCGIATPDGYGVLNLPDLAPVHLLLELDRGTEPAERLREKAVRYSRAIPRSALRDMNPLILMVAPTAARARTARAAVAGPGPPISVAVWTPASTRSVLGIVSDAAAARRDGAVEASSPVPLVPHGPLA
jgi:hypothetical protein